jgi:hypothetical protein
MSLRMPVLFGEAENRARSIRRSRMRVLAAQRPQRSVADPGAGTRENRMSLRMPVLFGEAEKRARSIRRSRMRVLSAQVPQTQVGRKSAGGKETQ